ncbi:GDSL-type esterase/lipase family protein [Pseudonocardia eucalypti]|uniref:GDSL-type esterase/lipase family protein n=1 Tax=Pseudonocardia eucalypti TaxID=648755 RepID=A0ABP9RF71_9PSEU
MLVTALTVATLGALPAPTARAATIWPVPNRPAALVVLGDSSASGEGAGDYQSGTRGMPGNWCHRSRNAYIGRTGLPGTPVNLACSGATAADVSLAPAGTEESQARKLGTLARTKRVETVVVQAGANDEPDFAGTLVSCATAYLTPRTPGCAETLAREWPDRLDAMAPKVERALRDVRTALRRAGYRDRDYTLIVASYPSPVTERLEAEDDPVGLRTGRPTPASVGLGCPFRPEDARWARTEAVPQLSERLREVADRVGARFLDLSRATEGHEACAGGSEWVRRLTVSPDAFLHGGLGHLAQESFHLNAAGHGKLADCLAEFVRSEEPEAHCVAGRLDASPEIPF